MKRRILSLLLIGTLILISNTNTAFAEVKNSATKGVISKESYEDKLLDNKTLFDKAEKGELVNNELTQVDVSYQNNGETKVIRINKKLGKEKYSNGGTMENYTVSSLFVTNIPGSKVETGTSGSKTVSVTVGMDYNKATFDGGTSYCYNVTKIYATPVLLDSTFTMTKLEQFIDGSGQGYTSDGTPTYVNEGKKSYSQSNPSSNTKYSLSTGYTKYILVNDGSGLGTNATITYKRPNLSTIYTYSFIVTIGA